MKRLVLALLALNAVQAEETVTFQQGCLAKVYVCGKYPEKYPLTVDTFKDDVPEWPINVLPH